MLDLHKKAYETKLQRDLLLHLHKDAYEAEAQGGVMLQVLSTWCLWWCCTRPSCSCEMSPDVECNQCQQTYRQQLWGRR